MIWLRLSSYFHIEKMKYGELLGSSIAFSKRLRAERSKAENKLHDLKSNGEIAYKKS